MRSISDVLADAFDRMLQDGLADLPLNRHSAVGLVDQASGIEPEMLRILGIAYDRRPSFVRADSLDKAIEYCFREPRNLDRHEILVFPQLSIGRYRPDFVVFVRGGQSTRIEASNIFIIECDGAEHHGSEHLGADRQRELDILRSTGIQMLRFSGGEINYAPSIVVEILSAQIEMMLVEQCSHSDRLAKDITRLRGSLSALTAHPLMRGTFLGRNLALPEEVDPEQSMEDVEFEMPIDRLRSGLRRMRQSDLAERRSQYDNAIDKSLRDRGYAICVDPVTCETIRMQSVAVDAWW